MDFFKLNHEATSEDIKNYDYPNRKIGVIVHIKNDNGDILLQQRGSKSRDENGLFEDVGGKFDDTDTSYKSAVIRELQEEGGDEAACGARILLSKAKAAQVPVPPRRRGGPARCTRHPCPGSPRSRS